MTTIIGIQADDHCIIAADSRATDDGGRPYSHVSMSKITKNGKYLISGAGSTLPCDIIQHIWRPPLLAANKKDLYHFMITEVAPSVRACLKENGYTPKESDESDFQFLIALNGNLFEFDDSLSVLLRDDGLYGIGSGSPYALGALDLGAVWKKALQVAAKNDVYTAPPFIMQRQDKV